jgi:predicted dinucleotide-binding enzyme
MTRYAVIGTGNIGATIGRKAAAGGLDVVFGVRSPRPSDLGAPEAPVGEAIAAADVIVLAVPGPSVAQVLDDHAEALAGKLVVDATNRMGGGAMHAYDDIVAVPGARYARAFNSLGFENFVEPDFDGTPADLFYAADAADRPVVEDLIRAVGLRPVAVGEAAKAGVVDSAATLWFALALGEGRGRHLAFRTLGI